MSAILNRWEGAGEHEPKIRYDGLNKDHRCTPEIDSVNQPSESPSVGE